MPETRLPHGGAVQVRIAPLRLARMHATMAGLLAPGSYLQIVRTRHGGGDRTGCPPAHLRALLLDQGERQGHRTRLGHGLCIVQQAGGGITVDSVVGEGTLVRVMLPAAEAPMHSANATALPTPARGTERVLVADDESGIRAVVATRARSQRVRNDRGCGRTCRTCGSSTIGATTSIFCSPMWVMPGMTGTELVDTLREQRPDLPVVLMSGFGEAESLSAS
jgi:hypothetical protein